MNGIKMYRTEEDVVKCKKCGIITAIGYNILQEEEFEVFKEECISKSLCPNCLKKQRIDSIVNCDEVLLKTVENMLAVGVI